MRKESDTNCTGGSQPCGVLHHPPGHRKDLANGLSWLMWRLSALQRRPRTYPTFFSWPICCCCDPPIPISADKLSQTYNLFYNPDLIYAGVGFVCANPRFGCVGAVSRFAADATFLHGHGCDNTPGRGACGCGSEEAKTSRPGILREHRLAKVYCRSNGRPIRVCEFARSLSAPKLRRRRRDEK